MKIENLKFLRIGNNTSLLNKFFSRNYFNRKKQPVGANGYTLIEVMIAMMITAVAFIGIYALFARTMQSDTEGRYEIEAAGLVQEGVEIIKNKRENNMMEWANWKPGNNNAEPGFYEGISDLTDVNPIIDLSGASPIFSFTNSSVNMQYNTSTGKYEAGCSGNCVGPIFTRKCTTTGVDVDSNPDKDSLRVVCTVEWDSLLLGGGKRSVKTEVILTDWQK